MRWISHARARPRLGMPNLLFRRNCQDDSPCYRNPLFRGAYSGYSLLYKLWLEASRFHSSGGKKSEKWSLSVKSQADLSSRVVRSSSCTVRIPELDLEVNPGSSSTGYVSNIEGVLNRFIEIIDMVARQTLAELTNYSPNSDLTLEELTSQVEKLNQMKMRLTGFDEQHFESFTLELLDPRGHSQILHPDATERELTEEEIKQLPIGPDPAVLEQ